MSLALLLIGLAILVWSVKLTLDRAIVIAQHYRLSDFVVGAVLLSIGSNLPELVVSVSAAVHSLAGRDMSGLIVGNVLGSCFGQLGLTMGVAGLVGYLHMPPRTVLRNGQALLGAMLAFFLAGLDGVIGRVEGVVLILFFALYVVLMFVEPKSDDKPHRTSGYDVVKTWVTLTLSLLVVAASSEVIVRAADRVADSWGVGQSFVGIVILGVGTSLPELSISVVAVLKARAGLSVGNLVGSNLLDVLLPAGLAAVIHPVAFETSLLWIDLVLLFALTLLVLVLFLRRRGLQRGEAILLVVSYASYLLFKIVQAG